MSSPAEAYRASPAKLVNFERIYGSVNDIIAHGWKSASR